MKETIPILIINWNGIEDTVECVNSVLVQSYSNFKIYLIDNGSDENNVKTLTIFFASNDKIELLLNTENLGFTSATNKVLTENILPQKYKYVVLLNNDTVVEKEWLSNLIRSTKENNADMISCKMIDYHNRKLINTAGHKMLNTGEILPIGNNESIDKYNTVFENLGPSAGACLYNVEMIRKIGLYDEYFLTGYEDAEYGVRAFLLGYKLIFEPKSIVYHKVSNSINKIRDYEYTLKIQLNIFYAYLKLMPLPIILINLPIILVRNLFILILFLLFFRFKYHKIYFKSIFLLLTRDRKKVLSGRKLFFTNQKLISSMQIFKHQEFFLGDNLKRFYINFIQGKKTIFEQFN